MRRQVPLDRPDNFSLSTADSIIEQFRSITSGIAITMWLVSSISLVVGGISVMNIMFVSVTERTREVGMRRAVGARRADILWQFLMEAVALTSIGGAFGLVIGWTTTLVIRHFVPSDVSFRAAVGGLSASVVIGLIFGLWPAWKAARLDPAASLHYE